MELLMRLDRTAGPVGRQLTDGLRQAIRDGRLSPGDRLPASRALAADLRVARNLVVAAYEELLAEGYLVGRQGSGTYVRADLPPSTGRLAARPPRPFVRDVVTAEAAAGDRWVAPTAAPPGVIEFRTGRAAVGPLPAGVWSRIWRAVGHTPPPADYGPPAGDPTLRVEVARYLGAVRGLACEAEDVTITAGATQAIHLVARATLRPGDTVGFEEPGPPPAREVFRGLGARLLPVPVDDDGLRVHELARSPVGTSLVYCTPSHQYPLGGRLPIARRLALLDWATATGSMVLEDDYDSEFRFDAPPLPALAGLGGDVRTSRVAYVGTFSKVVSPALRVGYLVGPPDLTARVRALKPLTDYHTSWPAQRAMAVFLAEGHLGRHVRRMRRHYAAKRSALRQALAPVADLAVPLGLAAGLHAALRLAPPLDPNVVTRAVGARGVVVTTLDGCYLGAPTVRGLLLGYGGPTVEEVREGGERLAATIADEAERLGVGR
jgi:GntR family transcriptional regulator/MocR family aminotransferase